HPVNIHSAPTERQGSQQPLTVQTTGPGGTEKPSAPTGLPEQFGRYRIEKQLGRGGMGTVYLAFDTHLKRRVALKVPHPHIAQDPASLERFYDEARAVARLDHPMICRVYDVGAIDGVHFMTMAFIQGTPLSSLLGQYLGEPARIAILVSKIADAMEHAHRAGIVHRDLKPHNVMIRSDEADMPIVMDFGLARCLDVDSPTRTSQGHIMGTVAYMSP